MSNLSQLRYSDKMLSRKFLFSLMIVVLQALLVFLGVLPANLYADIVSTTIFVYLGSNVANKYIDVKSAGNSESIK